MSTPLVGIVMGSKADLSVMEAAAKQLEDLRIPHTLDVLPPLRDTAGIAEWAATAADRGLQAIIVGASGAAHVAGIIAANSRVPVIGVPCLSAALGGADALFSMVQTPTGAPVATVGIDDARNAAILAARIIALHDAAVRTALEEVGDERADTEHREWTGERASGFGFHP